MFENIDPQSPTSAGQQGPEDIFAGVNTGGAAAQPAQKPPLPPAPPRKSGGLMRFAVIFIVSLVILAGVVFAGSYAWIMLTAKKPITPAVNNQNAVNLPVANTNVPTNEISNANNAENANATNTVTENTNTSNANANVNAEANTNTTNTNTAPAVIQVALDSDHDGLTDTEEMQYRANPLLADTDGDGFPDGQELLNLFSPIAAKETLLQSGLVTVYTANGFTVYNPAGWQSSANDSKSSFLLTAGTGEAMKFDVLDNPNKLALAPFLTSLDATFNASNYTEITAKSGLKGLAATDGMTYYVDLGTGKVIKATYVPGSVTQLSFLTTLHMMVNSMSLAK